MRPFQFEGGIDLYSLGSMKKPILLVNMLVFMKSQKNLPENVFALR
jgi:hypothetical protein